MAMLELMRALPIFAGIPDGELERLAGAVGERRLDPGEVLFWQGEPGRACFVILAGELEVIARQGRSDMRLQVCTAGQVVGEMALLDASPRSATVRALTESHLVALDEAAFLELMRGNPAWSLDLLRSNAMRLRRTSQTMIDQLEAKNAELQRAYDDLQAAQAERIRLGRIDEELAVARRIQELFLPRQLPQPAGWQLAAFTRAAQAVGGDFFDCIELPGGRLGIVVADVCGKGVPAALFVALTRSLVRAAALSPGMLQRGDQANELLAGALQLANDYIAAEHGESNMFITLFYGVLDPATGALSYVNAGHNPPLLVAEGGARAAELENRALPLGIVGGQSFETLQASVAPGELLVGFSDGITEAMSPDGETFGDERLRAALREHAGLPAPELVAAVVGAVDRFAAGAPQADDMTLLIVRRLP